MPFAVIILVGPSWRGMSKGCSHRSKVPAMSLNPDGACITDSGASSEFDRDLGGKDVSILASYIVS